ncbi:MAG: ABC transporter permease [Gammaproteobacteria bacterium]
MSIPTAFDNLTRDVRYSLRGLARNPLFTVIAVVTLAIGIGANTAVFSVVDGVLLKPLPYPNSEELVSIWHDAPGAPGITAIAGGLNLSPSMLVEYREDSRSFVTIGLWLAVTASITGFAEPEQVPAAVVTGGALQTFGVKPLLGRWLDEADESLANAPVGLLGYTYWKRRFGGDRNVIGKTITVDGVQSEIVGVMPEGFRFEDRAVDVISAMRFDRSKLIPPPFCCNGVARLKPGVSLQQANADLARLLPIWIDKFPFANGVSGKDVYLDKGWRITPALRTLKANVVGNVGDVLWVVMAMIGIVLLIACANVTNLLLVRGEKRGQEFGVRAALGAGSWPIARTLLVEAALLALVGAVVGLGVGYAALQLLLALAPPQLPRLASIAMDGRALAFASGLTVVAAVAIGVVPMLRIARLRLTTALRGSRGGTAGRVQQRTQGALVVAQVALALLLLVSSGLMIRTFQALRHVEPGFVGAESLQTFRLAFPQQVVPGDLTVLQQQRAIVEAVKAIPGVTATGWVDGLPMEFGGANWDGIDVEGTDYGTGGNLALRIYRSISPEYLTTMGTRVIAGRDIGWADIDDTRAVTMISEGLAREMWGTPEAALGKKIRGAGGGGAWREIVGVVEDVRLLGADQPSPKIVYWPAIMKDFYRGQPYYLPRGVAFAVRSPLAGSPALTREIERAVWSVNASLPVASVRTMLDLYDRSLARTAFTLVMLIVAAAAALVLGVVGLYGVLSYAVSQRRREIAIRLALGAQPRAVQRHFVRYGVTLAGLGVLIGLVGAAGATHLMRAILYDVQPVDPLTYAAVAAGLTLVAALASWLPARRASAVAPSESLAAE